MAGNRLWRWDERPVPVAEHLIAAFTQRGIADGRRQNEGPCRGTTLLLHPVSSRPAPSDIGFEGGIEVVGLVQDLRQHHGILHGHATTFPHVRRAGVRRVPDQDDPAAIPRLDFDPFDRSNMELLVTL